MLTVILGGEIEEEVIMALVADVDFVKPISYRVCTVLFVERGVDVIKIEFRPQMSEATLTVASKAPILVPALVAQSRPTCGLVKRPGALMIDLQSGISLLAR